MTWLEVEVRVVPLAEKELIVGAPSELAPHVFHLVVDVPLLCKNTVVGGTVILAPY